MPERIGSDNGQAVHVAPAEPTIWCTNADRGSPDIDPARPSRRMLLLQRLVIANSESENKRAKIPGGTRISHGTATSRRSKAAAAHDWDRLATAQATRQRTEARAAANASRSVKSASGCPGLCLRLSTSDCAGTDSRTRSPAAAYREPEVRCCSPDVAKTKPVANPSARVRLAESTAQYAIVGSRNFSLCWK